MTKNIKNHAFTLAEILIVLVIIGVLTMILLPMAFQSSPDEKATKFKKGYNTLNTVIKELVTSDRYYQNGDLGIRANGVLIDRTHEGDFTYFCETFADVISTKSVNCSQGGLNNYGSIQLAKNGEEVTSDILKDKKEQLDSTCALEEVQEDYYESGPERTFGSNYEGWDADENRPVRDNLARAFASPGEMNPHFKDSNGFDSNYKIFCMDIDEPNEGEIPFGFGIRADGRILNGARADEWMNKSI